MFFTEQQRETMRKVFKYFYNRHISANRKYTFISVRDVANHFGIEVLKAKRILNALVACGYIERVDENPYFNYVVTVKGVTRYEAYLELNKEEE